MLQEREREVVRSAIQWEARALLIGACPSERAHDRTRFEVESRELALCRRPWAAEHAYATVLAAVANLVKAAACAEDASDAGQASGES